MQSCDSLTPHNGATLLKPLHSQLRPVGFESNYSSIAHCLRVGEVGDNDREETSLSKPIAEEGQQQPCVRPEGIEGSVGEGEETVSRLGMLEDDEKFNLYEHELRGKNIRWLEKGQNLQGRRSA